MILLYAFLIYFTPVSAETWQDDVYVIWALPDNAKRQTAVVSNSDWLNFYDSYFGTPGTRAIINEAASAGIRTIWWRVSAGGVALYPSNVPEASVRNHSLNAADYAEYDSLKDAIEYGHKLGMKVFAWYTPLEESHSWFLNSQSHYVTVHEELYERSANGTIMTTPSFYYPQFRKYKSDWVRDIVSRYDIDGLAIDFERKGGPARNNNMGYIPQAVKEFQKKSGRSDTPEPDDKQWMEFRAEWVEAFLRETRKILKDKKPDMMLEFMVHPAVPLSAHWDTFKWADEKLFDRLVMLNHGPEGWASPGEFPEKQYANYSDKPVSFAVVNYAMKADRDTPAEVTRKRLKTLMNSSVSEIVWFETQYLHERGDSGVKRYAILREAALPDRVVIESPKFDFSRGGRIQLISAGRWKIRFDNDAEFFANGDSTLTNRKVIVPSRQGRRSLVVECEVDNCSSQAGFALQGEIVDSKGQMQKIHTNADWRVIKPAASKTVTIAQPGIPPFLGE